MREDVVALLDAFGVMGAADDPLLDFIISTVTERIKNETNQPTGYPGRAEPFGG